MPMTLSEAPSCMVFESLESVKGYGFLRHAACFTLLINPPHYIGGVESVRAWRGPVEKKKG